MTDYEMICQESKNLSTEEQAQVLQYIQSIQNEKGGGKREAEKAEHCPRCGGNSVYRGVATQYINRYNILFSTVYRAKESLSNIADAILRNVSVRVFSCWDVRHTDLVTI